jgi:DUF2889 family protein
MRRPSDGTWDPPPADPLPGIPARRPGSVRRTMHVDVGARTEWGVALPMSGAARDLRTGTTGADDVTVLAQAALAASFDADRTLVGLETTPAAAWTEGLIGARAGGGFRRRVDEALPAEDAGSLLRMVLDDLPAASLISGYAWMRLARRQGAHPASLVPADVRDHMGDLCSGWRLGGEMMASIEANQGVPIQDCPPATDLAGGDALGWHDMTVLAPDWMRRRRCIDLWADEDPDDGAGSFGLWAMFRDSVGDPGGGESVLHEYAVEIDGTGDVVDSIRAVPRVLPFPECPAAAGAVDRLVGRSLADFGSAVPATLVGIESCTHLNDLLRTLGAAAGLLAELRRA